MQQMASYLHIFVYFIQVLAATDVGDHATRAHGGHPPRQRHQITAWILHTHGDEKKAGQSNGNNVMAKEK